MKPLKQASDSLQGAPGRNFSGAPTLVISGRLIQDKKINEKESKHHDRHCCLHEYWKLRQSAYIEHLLRQRPWPNGFLYGLPARSPHGTRVGGTFKIHSLFHNAHSHSLAWYLELIANASSDIPTSSMTKICLESCRSPFRLAGFLWYRPKRRAGRHSRRNPVKCAIWACRIACSVAMLVEPEIPQ